MSTFANQSKTANSTFTNYVKAGYGWQYDQPNIDYDMITEEVSNLPVNYDSLGTLPVYSNVSKSAVSTFTNETKN